MESYSLAWQDDCPFGRIAAISLPAGMEAPPEEVLARLPDAEAEFARGLRGRRAIEWVGGRLALRAAASSLGMKLPPVLPGERGEPLLPPGVSASISHKRSLAASLVATAPATVGLDIEELERDRSAIAPRVLRPEEIEEWEALPEAERWPSLLGRFAGKEAIYKALHPHVRRFVAFEEAAILGGRVQLHLARGEGPFHIDLWHREREGLLIAAAGLRA